jgi:hypothetical protein
MTLKKTGYTYAGRRPCGCVAAIVLDCADRYTAHDVADFIKRGLSVERMPSSDAVDAYIEGEKCPHRVSQLALITSEGA